MLDAMHASAIRTHSQVVGEEIIADGVVEDAHQLQSTSPASESTDDLYTCIAGLLVSKAIEKAILLEKLREAEEKAALAERGKDEVSSSIQASAKFSVRARTGGRNIMPLIGRVPSMCRNGIVGVARCVRQLFSNSGGTAKRRQASL